MFYLRENTILITCDDGIRAVTVNKVMRFTSVAARGRGEPGHVPGWKGLCPGGRSGTKLIELTQKVKGRATVKLQYRRMSSQCQCHDTVGYFLLSL